MRRYRHVVRLFGLLAVGGLLFLVVRSLFVPDSFYRMGDYRADHLTEAARQPQRHSGDDACLDCHDKEWDMADGRHADVACENCHYLPSPHAVADDRPAAAVDAVAQAAARRQARLAFDSLYAAMAKGWDKGDIDRLAALLDKGAGDMRLRLWRGRAVADQYGPRRQEIASDKHVDAVFAKGMEATVEEGNDLRFLFPIRVGKECLACHDVEPGSVNGVIEAIYPETKVALLKYRKLAEMPIDRSADLCLRCHLDIQARPESFPEIADRAAHVKDKWRSAMGPVDEQAACLTCHRAHDPRGIKGERP